jgi:hydroxypyruvate reductase
VSDPPSPAWADHRSHALSLRQAALKAADPAEAVRRYLRLDGEALVVGDERLPLKPGARVFLAGGGKAGAAMAAAARDILGARLKAGCLAAPALPERSLAPVELVQGGHPVPDEGSLAAGARMAAMLAEAQPGDIVLGLVSGGASALLEHLAPGVTLADLQATTQAMLRSGATVVEINTLRKRLSQIKGGGLARLAAPADVAGLILSDVVGDPLANIGSGPTVPQAMGAREALAVVERYHLEGVLPASVMQAVRAAPPAEPAGAARVVNQIVGSNALAAQAAVEQARELGFQALLLSTFVEGEAREVGRVIAGLAKGMRRHGHPLPPPACLVLGGETTVTVRGDGAGGRNQEAALAAAIALDGWERVMVVTLATDGVDGMSPAAGALATGETAARARALGLSPRAVLDANDSYHFFAALGDAILTGPTGTNVNDLTFVCVYE